MAMRKFLFMSAEGYPEEQASSDEMSLGKLTLAGVSGVAIDAGTAKITNLGTPTADTDACTKAYADAVATGLDPKAEVEAVATVEVATLSGLSTTVDGVALDTDGMRVLLTAQDPASENGIWVVHSGAWTRPTDFAVGAHAAGAFTFSMAGTSYTGSGWVCTTKGPTDVIGTNNLVFVQFSSISYTAGNGIQISANAVSVKKYDGITVDSNGVSVDIAASSGLALTGTSPNKELAWAPDTLRGLAMDATGAYLKLVSSNPGVMFDGTGALDAKLKANTGLEKDASGIFVKVNSAKNNLVVDANGLRVTKAPVLSDTRTASGAVSQGDGVYVGASNAVSTGNNSSDATAHIIGVASAAIADAAQGEVISYGVCPGVLSGATPNTPYYLGPTGQPVLAGSVGASKRNVMLGYAISATDLFVEIRDYGKKAA